MEPGTLVSKTKTYVVYPEKFRVDANVAGSQVVQVVQRGHRMGARPGRGARRFRTRCGTSSGRVSAAIRSRC